MQINFKQLRVNLHPETYKKLEESLKKGTPQERTITMVVREALDLYLSPPPPKIEPEKTNELEYVTVRDIQEKGLKVEDVVKAVPDPEIQEVSLTSDIKPGPGAADRLKATGVKAYDVIKAKRNKKAGREYDKSLEQYFDLL